LLFALQEFSLDLVDRTWKVRLGYEVRLLRDRAFLAKQFATGEAERLKILGPTRRTPWLEICFADVMNRLESGKALSGCGQ